MSIQPTSIILGSRIGAPPEESAVASLLQTLSKVLSVARRRWPLLAVPMLTTMLITLSIGLTYPPRYYVTATFERRNNLVISKLIASNSPYSFTSLRQSLATDFRNFLVVGATLEEAGLLDHLPRDASGELTSDARAMRDDIVGRWVDSISVIIREPGDFSDLVEVRYLGEQPELAASILNKLQDNYIASTRSKVAEVLNDARAFFEQESGKCQQTVASLRGELRQIDIDHPGTNPTTPETIEHKLQAVSQSIDQLERERQKVAATISSCEAYLSELSTRPSQDSAQANRPAAVDRGAVTNPQYQQAAAEIAGLNKKIEEMKATRGMTDMHPEIVTLRARIAVLQGNLDKLPEHLDVPLGSITTPADPWLAERKKTEIEIKTHRESLARLERELKEDLEERDRIEKDMRSLPERREHYAKLQQALASAQNDLDLWNNNLTQLNRILTAEAENRGIQVVSKDQPHMAGRLHAPTANGFFALSGGLGLALAIAIVFLREILDRSVKDPARVKQTLGIPILETIGEIQIGRPPGWFLRNRLLPAFVTLQTLAVGIVGMLVYLALERPELYGRVIARSTNLLSGWTGGA